jgi:hypothetical protein
MTHRRRPYSSEGLGSGRGCPWVTAPDRCFGHVQGTAGEDEADADVTAMATSSTSH